MAQASDTGAAGGAGAQEARAGAGLRELACWQALERHRVQLGDTHLRELFARDPARGAKLSAQACGVYLDYSKQRLTGETVSLLAALARERGLEARRAAMFAGERINVSEDRPVLHVALRAPRERSIMVDGEDVVAQVHAVLERAGAIADAVRSGRWRGHTGEPIRNIVNIGIGGSDLGPAMAYEALRPFSDRGRTFRFVSNVDGSDFAEATRDLDPAQTLFVVCSKSWHTQETLVNATTARRWLLEGLGATAAGGGSTGADGSGADGPGADGSGADGSGADGSGAGEQGAGEQAAVARHFVAISTNAQGVREFGIDTQNMLPIWDWVGGRYSYDSAVGLSLMIAIGPERFGEMLAGMRAVDEHFCSAPLERNLPALMGLIGVWNQDFLGAQTLAVLPYSRYLARFPAYLQQLKMESNGKRVTLAGDPVQAGTGEIVWGEPGTNGQHAFYQLLHQGTRLAPCDLIGFCAPLSELHEQHDLLIANLFAQGEALAFGRSEQELREQGVPDEQISHRVCPGNRPTSTLLLERLDPAGLGTLVALYEHCVFTQGVVWGIDSFDQWGVELGKVLARRIAPELTDEAADQPAGAPARASVHDSSTSELIRRYRRARGRAA